MISETQVIDKKGLRLGDRRVMLVSCINVPVAAFQGGVD